MKSQEQLSNSELTHEKLVSADELAGILGVKKSWVRWQTHIKGIPVFRIGKYRKYSVTQVLTSLQGKTPIAKEVA